MNRLISCFALVSLLFFQSAVGAAEEQKSPYSGELKLGFSKLTGNVETESLAYGVKLKYAPENSPNSITFKLDVDEAEQSGFTYQDHMEASLLDIYKLNDVSSLYLKASYKEDPIRLIQNETDIGAGYLHTWVNSGGKSFTTRLGVQFRESEFAIVDHALDDSRQFALFGFRGGLPIMENIYLSSEFNWQSNVSDSEDYETNFSVALSFKVNEKVNISIYYKTVYDNLPVTGVKDTDEILSTNIQYNF
ncbi:MAG: DUF481 domain-containing protein [Gammaproteobacteria bacterium]|nr:DUF481 domain-containing protein [Gammaproteobacteria bacterium]